ncbi:putative MarR-family transcriptional regulator [Agrobacterium tumefaciens str. Kerr 14]|uniref:Putative MarR-family transcriptional regulator n=1 Tax=Agrobacterium tumefaciens str. Kerr 14 TaxID=1183424 RepID=A0A1S7SBF6_AGRTU|nr:MarR family transcriptional regulator [Agrobacterium tumefaciens]CUX65258.1 putative MarR-family transcriptional regulator [Agrobacterium tumefaciens str. Kerr 14]
MSIPLDILGRLIKQLQARHHRLFDSRLGEIGSSLAQWDALRAIDRNPGASSHALAEYTFQTDQSFGALAGRLLDKGLVQRLEGKGRAIHYELTERGQQILSQGTKLTDDVLASSFAPLQEDEREILLGLLTRLSQA